MALHNPSPLLIPHNKLSTLFIFIFDSASTLRHDCALYTPSSGDYNQKTAATEKHVQRQKLEGD
jgi:hypothetical protein